MEYIIRSLDDLGGAAEWLAQRILESGFTVVALDGAMGAGKTTLIGEFARQRGVLEGISSPTFAIVNEYLDSEGEKIYHFDCYRFESEQEAMDIGVFDYFDSGSLCFVEWGERISNILEECDVLTVNIELQADNSRRLFLNCEL